MGFGANIRKLRTMEHLGQAQLAEMLGVLLAPGDFSR